ncbi:MAG: DNA polymerase V [Thermoproteota archaeon]|jgi:DNA polymerase V
MMNVNSLASSLAWPGDFIKKIVALVDCNSFYASCERVFNPSLNTRPVIVLSNNDGCAITRTREAKDLGIKMGAPYFQIKELCHKNNVAVFSSNFALYTDLSARVMQILYEEAPRVEVYSVDEAFLDFSEIKNLQERGELIRNRILTEVKIPTGVGIATTKVLAKVANHLAKKSTKTDVVNLVNSSYLDYALEKTHVGDLWGVGRANTIKMKQLGIHTAKDLRDFKNDKIIQSVFTKVGLMIKNELNGISCFDFDLNPEKKKEIMCSRTFAQPMHTLTEMKEVIANYISDVGQKLRAQNSLCLYVEVFARTNPNSETDQFYLYQKGKFQNPTSDTRKLIVRAFELLEKSFKSGYAYKKAGIKVSGLRHESEFQMDFFSEYDSLRDRSLMESLDRINHINGYTLLKSAACGTEGLSWRMNRKFKSAAFTTDWNDLLKFN